MKMNELLKLISRGENKKQEFKESLRLKEEIGQGVFAFSMAKTLVSIDSIYLLIGFVLYLRLFLRTLRFHILLNNKVSIKDLFSIVCVHNMANNILPARTGEVFVMCIL